MEKTFEIAATQVPALVVMAFFVIAVLKFLRAEREASQSFVQNLHDEHLDARRESRLVIEKNMSATEKNTEALIKLRDSVIQSERMT